MKPTPSSSPPDSPHCVLIPPLHNLSLTSKAGILLGELLSQELEAITPWEILSPIAYLSLISRLELSNADPLDPSTLLFYRDRLGLDTLIYGTITEYWYTDDPEVYRDKQPAIAVILRVFNTGSGEEILHIVVSDSYTSLFGDTMPLTALAQKVASQVAELLKNRLGAKTDLPTQGNCRFIREIAPPLATTEPQKPIATLSQPPAVQSQAGPPPPSTASASQEILTLINELTSGKTIILKGVKFKKGSLELIPKSEESLSQLAEILKADPTMRVRLTVHTDNEGTAEELLQLSEKQAEILRTLFVETYKIPPERIEVVGRGGMENIVPNTNEFLKEVNRRVEVVLLSRQATDHGKTESSPR